MFKKAQNVTISGSHLWDIQGDVIVIINGPCAKITSRTTPVHAATTSHLVAGNGFPNQVSFAHVYDSATEHALYESFCHTMGTYAGLIATIPFVPFPSPFHTIPHGSVGCIFHFGRLSRITDPGLTKVNGWTETLRIMKLTSQDVLCGRQVVITRDNKRVKIDLVIDFHIFNPHLVVTRVEHPRKAVIRCTKAALRHAVGARDSHAVDADRKALIREVLEDVKSSAYGWGIAVEDISIAYIRVPKGSRL